MYYLVLSLKSNPYTLYLELMIKNRPISRVLFDIIMRFFKLFCVYIFNTYLSQSGWNLRDRKI